MCFSYLSLFPVALGFLLYSYYIIFLILWQYCVLNTHPNKACWNWGLICVESPSPGISSCSVFLHCFHCDRCTILNGYTRNYTNTLEYTNKNFNAIPTYIKMYKWELIYKNTIHCILTTMSTCFYLYLKLSLHTCTYLDLEHPLLQYMDNSHYNTTVL